MIKLLFVNDHPDEYVEFQRALTHQNDRAMTFEIIDGTQKTIDQKRFRPEDIDVVVFRVPLQNGRRFELFSCLPQNAREIPILVMTDQTHQALALDAVQQGAQEAWVKGEIQGPALRRLIIHAMERHRTRSRLYSLCMKDELTGLYNRRGFVMQATERLAGWPQQGFCLSLLDMDGLKKINDSLGHVEGDRAIVYTANFLRQAFRKTDIIARLGGDEFAVLTIESAKDLTRRRLVRLQQILSAHNNAHKGPLPLSLSAGVLYFKAADSLPLEDLMHRADQAMYNHKQVNRRAPGRQPYVFDENSTSSKENFHAAAL